MKKQEVTVWHRVGTGYVKYVCSKSSVVDRRLIHTGGVEETVSQNVTVRCFFANKPDISVGDRVITEKRDETIPPSDALVIKEIRDNYNASRRLRHYRLECV